MTFVLTFRTYVDGELVLSVPNPPIDQNPDWVDFYTFGAPWNDPGDNPWASGTNMAPFDTNVTQF